MNLNSSVTEKDSLKSSLLENKSNQQNEMDLEPEMAHQEKKYNSYENANIFNKFTFHWVTPMMKYGNKHYLEQKDHDPLSERQQSYNVYQNFKKYWDEYSTYSSQPLYRTLISYQRGSILFCFILQGFVAAMDLIKPLLIGLLIKYAGKDAEDKSIGEGIGLLIAMITAITMQSILSFHADFQFNLLGYSYNNSVIIAMFEKSLRVSLLSNKAYKQGEIINLAQTDANRLFLLCNQIAMMVFLPIQLVVGLWLVYKYVGVSFVGGLLVILVIGIANYFTTRWSVKYQKILMKDKDRRMKITNEIFGQIKFIKVNAWEEFFYDRLDVAREQELKTLKVKIWIQILSIIIFWLSGPLILNAVFAWYTLSGHLLDPGTAFPVISLFNSLSAPIQGIPTMINNIIECHTSIKRMEKYLQTEEIDIKYITQKDEQNEDDEYAIVLKKGQFTWGAPLKGDDDDDKKKNQSNLKSIASASNTQTQNQGPKLIGFEIKEGSSKNNTQESPLKTRSESYSESKENGDKKEVQFKKFEKKEYQELSNDEEDKLQNNSEQKQKEDLVILKDLNLKIKKGQMVAFIGDVACGKSSFLYSLIGEMKHNKSYQPELQINGKLALVNQKPWVLSDTIQNNIVFGEEFDQQRYDDTIKYSCLTHDFTVLTNGDQTMIGEKGVNLSGGQKARIALARAVYSSADILLLDDILSAVDIHVGKSIVKECLMDYKKETTRVLVTHALSYVKYMDYIYMMDKGKIMIQGTYEELKNSQEFKNIYEKFMKEQYDKEEQEKEQEKLKELEDTQLLHMKKKISKEEEEQQKELALQMQIKKKKSSDHITENDKKEAGEEKKDKYDDLILEEDRKKGDVSLDVYWRFIQYNGGWWFIAVVLLASTVSQAFRILGSLWMVVWTDNGTKDNNDYYLGMYTFFSIGISLGAGIRSTTVLLCCFRTGRRIHKGMISNLLYAPLNEFFDRIPLGRILNRLSKDLNILDTMIAFSLASFLASVFYLLGTIFLCVYSSSIWVLIPIAIYLLICIKLYKFYITANRELVRLEGITKSPVVSYFSETLNGLDSVRAYKRQQDFIQKHCENIDENKKNQMMVLASNIWFRLTLSLGSIIINITSVSFSLFGTKDSQSMAGLLLTYAISLDMIARWMVMMMGWFEQRLVSFERCVGFLEIDNEPGYSELLKERDHYKEMGLPMPKNEKLLHWPHEGVIEFKEVQVKYRKNLDPVLKGITCTIKKEEKVGIVGRTGAGKSTVTLCLLRVLELLKGQIIIDGHDISELSLDELRTKITTILQDPQLFEGTLKANIDPLNQHSDEDVRETLIKCNLEKLLNDREGINTQISADGGNLSVGEKQLICIARALLKKSKVVLIDEATANIDIQTEHMVQQTIKTVFKDCTVLTIAHRINTILESDRILVLADGKIEEFDSPSQLLKNSNSLFYKLHSEALKENNI